MKKLVTLLPLIAIMAFVGCSSDSDKAQPILTLSSTSDVLFLQNDLKEYTIYVATSTEGWNAVSDQDWCSVIKNSANSSFIVSIKEGTTLTDGEATITVTGISGTKTEVTTTIKARISFSAAAEVREDMTWVDIPSGSFDMGADNLIVCRPVHSVILTKGFKMSAYETTNAQYAAFLNAMEIKGQVVNLPRAFVSSMGVDEFGLDKPSYTYVDCNFTVAKGPTNNEGEQVYLLDCTFNPQTPNNPGYPEDDAFAHEWGLKFQGDQWVPVAGFENHPVINVSWYGAIAFSKWIGGNIPSEAQWEYVARLGGGDTSDEHCWGPIWEGPDSRTHQVGTKLPNSLGIFDMMGNVSEFVLDRFRLEETLGRTYPPFTVIDPVSNGGTTTVLRGGGYLDTSGFEISPAGRLFSNLVPLDWQRARAKGFRTIISE